MTIAERNQGSQIHAIFQRLKEIEGKRYDKDLSMVLMADENTVASWKKRNAIPWRQLADYSARAGVSLEYLIHGKGPVRTSQMTQEEGTVYQVSTSADSLVDLAGRIHDLAEADEKVTIPPGKFSTLMGLLVRDSEAHGNAPVSDNQIKGQLELFKAK